MASVFFIISPNSRSEEPFWKAKAKVYKRITEKQEIIVAVRTHQISGDKKQLTFQGGGRVRVPEDFAYSQSIQFTQLPQVSSYIKEVKILKPGKEIFVHSAAFGYHAKMWIQLDLKPHDSPAQIGFQIIKGDLEGLKGHLTLEKMGLLSTEMGIDGKYDFKTFPIPSFFAKFGLEVIMQHMAARLRAYLQEKYSKVTAVHGH